MSPIVIFKNYILSDPCFSDATAFAQEHKSDEKKKDAEALEDVKPTTTSVKLVDVADQVFTNRRLWAQSGSLSLWRRL